MKVIGLTGGIGSGKSTVAKLCQEYFKVAVIETDQVAREQMMPGGCSYDEVINEFGTSILQTNGEINRAFLAKLIFEDPDKVKKINEITHPKVKEYTQKEIKRLRDTMQYEAVLVETALLFEAEFDKFCDETWCVYAMEETRRARLCNTRGYSNEKIDAILLNQDKEEDVKKQCTHQIQNEDSTTQEELLSRLKEIFSIPS